MTEPQASLAAIEIRRTKDLSEEDHQKLFGWGENLFGVLPFDLSWRTKDWHVIAYLEGAPVAHAGVLRHDVLVDSRPVPVGGLGGVITVLEYRNRGLAQLVVQEAVAFMAGELGADFGFLFCLPPLVPFYEKMGWQELAAPVLVDQPGGEIESPVHSMVLPLRDEPWPQGRVRTQSLPW
jgi:GNAT superfamily N-acetyltransferase